MALQLGQERLERQTLEPRSHATHILPWIEALLEEAGIGYRQVDRLVVSRGPGGFTSLRIGLAIAQGLALAQDLPVHPVSSLDALAQSADPDHVQSHLLTLLDARMSEIYAAWYRLENGHRLRVGEEWLGAPAALFAPGPGPWKACGPGAHVFHEELKSSPGSALVLPDPDSAIVWPQARALLALADSVPGLPGHRIVPTYLRDQVTG